jgi:hypothetical protein
MGSDKHHEPSLDGLAKVFAELHQALTAWTNRRDELEKLEKEVQEATRKWSGNNEAQKELAKTHWKIKQLREEVDKYSSLRQQAGVWSAALNRLASHTDLDERDKAFWSERFRTDPPLRDDWGFWAWYLEHGGPVFEELRPVLVKALRGEKRPSQRIKSVTTYLRQVQIATFVSAKERDGCRPDKAVQQAADKFGVTKRMAQAAVAKFAVPDIRKNSEDYVRIIPEFLDALTVLARLAARGEKK